MPLQSFLEGLKVAATHPFAFVSYSLLLVCWTFLVAKGQRLKKIASIVRDLPEDKRTEILLREYPEYPRSGLSAEQWLRSRRNGMVLVAFLAFLLAATLIVVVSLVQSSPRRIADLTTSTDWQMFLVLKGARASIENGTELDFSCFSQKTGTVSAPPPLILPAGKPFLLDVVVNLVVDNIFHKFPDLIYPIGLTTTWDRTMHVIYDGRDANQWRLSYGPKMDRNFLARYALVAPASSGQHYILIMTGAAYSIEQVFHGSSEATESANSVWNLPLSRFAGHECTGYLERPFIHTGGRQERVLWPLVAIPVTTN